MAAYSFIHLFIHYRCDFKIFHCMAGGQSTRCYKRNRNYHTYTCQSQVSMITTRNMFFFNCIYFLSRNMLCLLSIYNIYEEPHLCAPVWTPAKILLYIPGSQNICLGHILGVHRMHSKDIVCIWMSGIIIVYWLQITPRYLGGKFMWAWALISYNKQIINNHKYEIGKFCNLCILQSKPLLSRQLTRTTE